MAPAVRGGFRVELDEPAQRALDLVAAPHAPVDIDQPLDDVRAEGRFAALAVQLVERGRVVQPAGLLVQRRQRLDRRRIAGQDLERLGVAGARHVRGPHAVAVEIAGDQVVAGRQLRVGLAGRAGAEALPGPGRLGRGRVGLGQRGVVAAGQRVALAQREDRQVAGLRRRQRRDQRTRRVVVAGAEQGVGAPQREAERARGIRLLRLPALDQLGQLVVLAERLGEIGEIGHQERLAGRQLGRLLQVRPGAIARADLVGGDARLPPPDRDHLAAQADGRLGDRTQRVGLARLAAGRRRRCRAGELRRRPGGTEAAHEIGRARVERGQELLGVAALLRQPLAHRSQPVARAAEIDGALHHLARAVEVVAAPLAEHLDQVEVVGLLAGHRLAGRRQLGPHVFERRVVSLAQREPLEPVQRGQAGRIGGHRLLIALGRLARVADLVLQDVAALDQQIGARRVVGREAGLGPDELDQVRPQATAVEDAPDGPQVGAK